MHPSELQLGDIIFFSTKHNAPDHVAMYTGMIDGEHYVTHSIINDTPGLQTTVLKDGQRLDVFRPANAELGTRAAQRLLAWAKYRIPYDSRRANLMRDINQKINTTAAMQRHEEATEYILRYFKEIAKNTFYCQVKFAARRDTCPVKMLERSDGRGFTCAQSVILAYQVESLVPYVKTLEQIKNELACLNATSEQITDAWISDKNCSPKITAIYDLPESYVQYATALRSSKEFFGFDIKNNSIATFTHNNSHPSLVAWNFDKEPSIDLFINNFDFCLDLPAKICKPSVLFWYMQKNTRHWVNMGTLTNNLLPLTFSFEEKNKHRIRKENFESEVAYNRSQIYRRCKLDVLLSSYPSASFATRSKPQSISSVSNIDGISSIEDAKDDTLSQLDTVIFSPLIAQKYSIKNTRV